MTDDQLPEGLLMPLFWHPWYPIFVFLGVFAFLLIPALTRQLRKSQWEGLSLVAYGFGLLSVIGIIVTGRSNLVQFIVVSDREMIESSYRYDLSSLQRMAAFYDRDLPVQIANDPIINQISAASSFFHQAALAFGEGYEAGKWRRYISEPSPEASFPPLKDEIPLHRNVYSYVRHDYEDLHKAIKGILLYEDRIAKALALNSDKQIWDFLSWFLSPYLAAIALAIQSAKASAGIRGLPPDLPVA